MSKGLSRGVVELLEGRRLLSGGTPSLAHDVDFPTLATGSVITGESLFITSKGTLVVEGTAADDLIIVSRGGGKITFSRTSKGGSTFTGGNTFIMNLDPSKVRRILVEAGDGDDHVVIARDIARRATVVGGAGDDTLIGSAGDTLQGGSGDDKLVVQPLDPAYIYLGVLPAKVAPEGPALLVGGAGRDTLVADAADSVVGGQGDDLAIQHVYFGDDPTFGSSAVSDDLPGYARQQFGSHASGVESFDVWTDRVFAMVEYNNGG